MMLSAPNKLRDFDVFVFDEIHALLEDTLFVPYTGYILSHLKKFFGDKIRLYMSATPEEILPYLARAEAPYRLAILRFHRNYSYVQPYFFHDESEVVCRINEDKSSQRWLIFAESVRHGEQIRSQFCHPVRMMNSVVREQDPSEWDAMLVNEGFNEKVAITTAVIDSGVNLRTRHCPILSFLQPA